MVEAGKLDPDGKNRFPTLLDEILIERVADTDAHRTVQEVSTVKILYIPVHKFAPCIGALPDYQVPNILCMYSSANQFSKWVIDTAAIHACVQYM